MPPAARVAVTMTRHSGSAQALWMLPALLGLMGAAEPQALPLPVADFRRIDRDSGRDHYFRVATEDGHSFLALDYRPPMETETVGTRIPDNLRKLETRVSWRWRVRAFPKGGDECVADRGDSAAGVFLTFHAGMKWLILKYIWSETQSMGTICDRRGGAFLNRQTMVLESGGALGTWHQESVDPKAEYVRHFGGKLEDVPDLVGIGVLTDGDQTKSVSAADYGDFVLETRARP
jgi:Protein of unknown function (DUF3047)